MKTFLFLSIMILPYFLSGFVETAYADYCANSLVLDRYRCFDKGGSYPPNPPNCGIDYAGVQDTYTCTADPNNCVTTGPACSSNDYDAMCKAYEFEPGLYFCWFDPSYTCSRGACWVSGPDPTPDPTPPPDPICGQNGCEVGEDCNNCAADCGACSPPGCNCSWIDQGCGLGGCAPDKMYEIKGNCNPAGCSSGGRCVDDVTCGPGGSCSVDAGVDFSMTVGETIPKPPGYEFVVTGQSDIMRFSTSDAGIVSLLDSGDNNIPYTTGFEALSLGTATITGRVTAGDGGNQFTCSDSVNITVNPPVPLACGAVVGDLKTYKGQPAPTEIQNLTFTANTSGGNLWRRQICFLDIDAGGNWVGHTACVWDNSLGDDQFPHNQVDQTGSDFDPGLDGVSFAEIRDGLVAEGADGNEVDANGTRWVVQVYDNYGNICKRNGSLNCAYYGPDCTGTLLPPIPPTYTVTGKVWYGTGSYSADNCVGDPGATPVGAGDAELTFATNPAVSVDGNGEASWTAIDNFYQMSVGNLPSGYVANCPSGGSLSANVSGADITRDFYVATSSRWWQTQGGDVGVDGGGIVNRIPIGCNPTSTSCLPYLTLWDGGADTSGVVVTDATGVDLDTTPPNWYTELSQGIDYQVDSVQVMDGVQGWTYFKNLMGLPAVPVESTGNKNNLGKPGSSGTYYYDGPVTSKREWDVSAGESYVIFVNGNLTLDRLNNFISVQDGGFLAFIVSGDIIFTDKVGRTFFGNPPSVQGVFIADGQIIVQDDTNQDRKFIGAGTFVGWGGVDIQRDFATNGSGIDNSEDPAALFIYRPDLVTNAPAAMRKPRLLWEEVEP